MSQQGLSLDFLAKVPEAYRRIKTANLGLERIDAWEAEALETGKNQCALAG